MSKIYLEEYHRWKIYWSDEGQKYIAERVTKNSYNWGIYSILLGCFFFVYGLRSGTTLSLLVGLLGMLIAYGIIVNSREKIKHFSIHELKRML